MLTATNLRRIAAFTLLVFASCVCLAYAGENTSNEVAQQLQLLTKQVHEQIKVSQQILEKLDSFSIANFTSSDTTQGTGSASGVQTAIQGPDNTFEPGWLASVYAVDFGYKVVDDDLPPAQIGHFTAKKSKYSLTDYREQLGMELRGKALLWRGEAYLYAREPGPYVFTLHLSHELFGSIRVEETIIGQGAGETVVAVVNLEPGMKRIQFRVAGHVDRYGKAFWNGYARSDFSMSIKSPSDPKPVPMADMLLVRSSQ